MIKQIQWSDFCFQSESIGEEGIQKCLEKGNQKQNKRKQRYDQPSQRIERSWIGDKEQKSRKESMRMYISTNRKLSNLNALCSEVIVCQFNTQILRKMNCKWRQSLLWYCMLMVLLVNMIKAQENNTSGNQTLSDGEENDTECISNNITCMCGAKEVYIQGECFQCQIQGCYLCEYGNPFKCDACYPNMHLRPDGKKCDEDQCYENGDTCKCGVKEIYYDGECKMCEIEGCYLCEYNDPYQCDSCYPGLFLSPDSTQCSPENCFAKETCLCGPREISYEGECVACQVYGCYLCEYNDPYQCDSCYPGLFLSPDSTQCSPENCFAKETCLCGPREISYEGECVACQVYGCYLCEYNDPYQCDSCYPGLFLSPDSTQCSPENCFAKETCLCVPREISYEGECVACQVYGCYLCEYNDPYQCDSCYPGLFLSPDSTQCSPENCFAKETCLCGPREISYEGECVACQVYGCYLCEYNDPYQCDSCYPGLFLSPDSTQCSPENCFAKETCLCGPREISYEGECVACQVYGCYLCEYNDPYQCDSCYPGLFLSPDSTQCSPENCFAKETCLCGPREISYEGECVACQVYGCYLCEYNNPYYCDSCLPGLHLTQNSAQCLQKICYSKDSNCPCHTHDIFLEGQCHFCSVQGCFLCQYNNPYKCDHCYPGLILSQDYTSCLDHHCSIKYQTCPCSPRQISYNGTCLYCQVQGCYLCSYNDPYLCDHCLPGLYLSPDRTYCSPTNCFAHNSTCSCSPRQIKYDGYCMSCQVPNCYLCQYNNPYKCDVCVPGLRPTSDYSRCWDGICRVNERTCSCGVKQISLHGECFACQVEDCYLCRYDDTEVCDSCYPGYYLSPNSTFCSEENCFPHMDTCSCGPKQLYIDGRCTGCRVSNCYLCEYNNPNKCDTCMPSFILADESRLCRLPYTCIDRYDCGCSAKQVFQEGQCKDCLVAGCYLCEYNDPNVCDKCMPGYVSNSDNTLCIHADYAPIFFCTVSFCDVCQVDDYGVCAECQGGFVLTNNITCQAPQCQGDLIFDGEECSCAKTYYLSEGTTCQLCTIDYCVDCSSSNSTNVIECTECYYSYYLNNGSCDPCMDYCQICQSGEDCTLCDIGYYFESSTGGCEGLSWGVSAFFTLNGVEVQCVGGCLLCSTATTCDECEDGYYAAEDICFPCDASCKTCDGGTSSDCESCYNLKVLDGSECVGCSDANCYECTAVDYCVDCRLGYAPLSGVCEECIENCLECDDTTTCSQCEEGLVFLDVVGECVQCQAGCSICSTSNITQCLQCSAGYYNSSSICTQCPTGCKQCTSSTYCTKCDTGYKPYSDICILSCNHPCYSCQVNQPDNCTGCYGGYTLSSDSCNVDTSCNSTSSCEACARGYVLDDGLCMPCDAGNNCAKCSVSDTTICTQCDSGYYIYNSTCTDCPTACSACMSSEYCTKCADGYYMVSVLGQDTGVCEECSSVDFCDTCIYTSTQCTSCLSNYGLEGIKCISDENVGLSMTLQTDYDNFILSIQEFKRAILDMLGGNFAGNTKLLTFNSIASGSVVIDSVLSVPSGETATNTYNTLSGSLAGDNELAGISLSTTVAANGFTIDDDDDDDNDGQTTTPEEEGANLALALGLGIPLLAVAILVIVIINARRKKQEDEDVEVSPEKETQEQAMQPIEVVEATEIIV